MKNMKKEKIFLIVGVFLGLLVLLGGTYAFFRYRDSGSNIALESGSMKISFASNTNYLNIPDAYPVSDTIGKIYPYYSDFTVSGSTKEHPIKYEIQVVSNSGNTIDNDYIKVYLTDTNDNPIDGFNGGPVTLGSLSNATDKLGKVVYSNVLSGNKQNDGTYTTNTINENYRLRLWIDEDYTIKNVKENFSFSIYLHAYNTTITYLNDQILSTLSTNLTEPDVDGTRYVTGQTINNNYVWYSGKLWRVVAINSDKTVKLVTQGNMTTISWSVSSDNNTDFTQNQISDWLNGQDYFLGSINTELLKETEWDYTTYESFPTEKNTDSTLVKTVSNKVGLLSIYDYMMTGGSDVKETSLSYLNNGYNWWTMTAQSADNVWYISDYNYAQYNYLPTNLFGVRPVVNLVSNAEISSGSGTETDPYIIHESNGIGIENSLLSNRVSGEYVKFDGVKYRIVGIENGLTKITMADYDVNKNTLSTSVQFGATSDSVGATYNTSSGIGLYLNDWYSNIGDDYKDMIATDGIVWYQGPADGTGRDFKLSKSGSSISAPIGLGYYGELFSSQFGTSNKSTGTWLMTKYSSSNVMLIYVIGNAGNVSPTITFGGVRPSFYLKSNVKIIDVDGDGDVGNGTKETPYEISLVVPQDTTRPVCRISSSTDMKIGISSLVYVECTDNTGFSDYDITSSDFTISNSSLLSLSNPVKESITNGYRYTIAVNPLAPGNVYLTLKSGSVKDTDGNANEAVTSIAITISYLTLNDKIETTLVSNLTEADVDGTRYVYGRDVKIDNNYVLYADKLWRIVALNSDGTVKLVTQNAMTTMAWDTNGGIDYSTSTVRTWLKNEFLPTISSDIIVESTWDYTTYDDFPSEKITNNTLIRTVSDKVGLLSIYDYMMTGGIHNLGGHSGDTLNYLDTGTNWWMISPFVSSGYSDVDNIWCGHETGNSYFAIPSTNWYGVRPAIVLKSGITITGGSGIEDDPYVLEYTVPTASAPVCTFSQDSYDYVTYPWTDDLHITVECTSDSEFIDSEVTIDNFFMTENGSPNNSSSPDYNYSFISDVTKTAISNGYSYTITAAPDIDQGIWYVYFNANSVSTAGGGNSEIGAIVNLLCTDC